MPRWVGGFSTEAEAKTARDEARVASRRGSYVDRSAVTVAAYLQEGLAGNAVAVPKTVSGYRADVEGYVIPRIGGMRLQNVHPATISKLYRTCSMRVGATASPFAKDCRARLPDAGQGVRGCSRDRGRATDEPRSKAKRPRVRAAEPGNLWTTAELRAIPRGRRAAPPGRVLLAGGLHRQPSTTTSAGLEASSRATFEHIRNLMMDVAPEVEEGTTYGMAALKYKQKPLLGFLAAKQHLSIFPFSSRVVDAVHDRLTAFELSKETIRFTARTSARRVSTIGLSINDEHMLNGPPGREKPVHHRRIIERAEFPWDHQHLHFGEPDHEATPRPR